MFHFLVHVILQHHGLQSLSPKPYLVPMYPYTYPITPHIIHPPDRMLHAAPSLCQTSRTNFRHLCWVSRIKHVVRKTVRMNIVKIKALIRAGVIVVISCFKGFDKYVGMENISEEAQGIKGVGEISRKKL